MRRMHRALLRQTFWREFFHLSPNKLGKNTNPT